MKRDDTNIGGASDRVAALYRCIDEAAWCTSGAHRAALVGRAFLELIALEELVAHAADLLVEVAGGRVRDDVADVRHLGMQRIIAILSRIADGIEDVADPDRVWERKEVQHMARAIAEDDERRRDEERREEEERREREQLLAAHRKAHPDDDRPDSELLAEHRRAHAGRLRDALAVLRRPRFDRSDR